MGGRWESQPYRGRTLTEPLLLQPPMRRRVQSLHKPYFPSPTFPLSTTKLLPSYPSRQMTEITQEQLEWAIHKLSLYKAPGLDGHHSPMLPIPVPLPSSAFQCSHEPRHILPTLAWIYDGNTQETGKAQLLTTYQEGRIHPARNKVDSKFHDETMTAAHLRWHDESN